MIEELADGDWKTYATDPGGSNTVALTTDAPGLGVFEPGVPSDMFPAIVPLTVGCGTGLLGCCHAIHAIIVATIVRIIPINQAVLLSMGFAPF